MRRDALAFLILLLAVLLACATTDSTKVGKNLWAVECGRSRANCYEEAAARCPYGFDLVDASERSGVAVSSYYGSTTVVPTYSGDMLIRCRTRGAK